MEKANITDTSKAAASNTHSVKPKPIYDFVKRVFDIVWSLIGLIVLSPVFIILSILVKTTSEGPVFFAHKRVGKGGKTIKIYKFRSMVTNAEELIKQFTPEQKAEYEKNFKLENDPRVTKVGNFMRKTSLDELPQLINILKGDISIVGPRPVMDVETKIYGNYRNMLLSVKPGLTGFWAANGRSHTTYTRRRAMEIYYVKNRSVLLDLKIIFKTFISVFKREGAV
ncbi:MULTISPECIES: sugar transferase [Eubacteriales]|jgi:lipopolysaccharide/colanic/teichoic acid biosynthesis glycosyltransferase|uniref:sugar transferase n=1 Tax=Eubacteriales TaxID=186802 RepID=UPI000E450A6C|nr:MULTISPECIES: sugar transferase [Eubacteriales]MBD9048844.1 sugar transferase [Ruminococcus sp.]RGM20944.1 sugar transferase [Eubacterium sp. OM08-24]